LLSVRSWSCYAILLVPILLLPAALGRREDPVLRAASLLYLTSQGDILATAVPDFPVWDLGGLLGSTLWGLWVLALGVAVLRSPVRQPAATAVPAPGDTRSYPS
jgi:hypothetical protein